MSGARGLGLGKVAVFTIIAILIGYFVVYPLILENIRIEDDSTEQKDDKESIDLEESEEVRGYYCKTDGNIPYMCGPDDPRYTGKEQRPGY
jgi:hypothetical protein